ncbi:MAG: hypothetical protein FJ399_04810 [Verrucomicrobia bacterium]|nr:hypothetical protein [Verrucomicrobiota bacterium]
MKLIVDVPYREGSPVWRVDIALPEASAGQPRAVILNVHGGGWSAGDKNGGRSSICYWAQRGYVGVSVRYRLLGEAPFPACIEDVKCAVRWLRAHASDYNIDPNRVGAFGHSAGAHLVAMLGVCPKGAGFDAGPWPEPSSLVNAACAVATPTDLAGSREVNRFPGATEDERRTLARRCSPLTYVNAEAPPFLLIHGVTDGTVPVEHGRDFAAALRAAGAKNVNLFLLDAMGHDPLPTHEAILRPLIDAFFYTTIGARAGVLAFQSDLARRWQLERASEQGFGFERVSAFDLNHDGKLSRDEWPGTDEMFARIDRGQNNVIEPAEMDAWRGRSPRPGRKNLPVSPPGTTPRPDRP